MSKTFENNVTSNQTERKENDNMNFDFQEDELIEIPETCKTEKGENITMEDIAEMKFADYRTEMVEGESTMKDIIFIHKEAGTKKDAVRVKRTVRIWAGCLNQITFGELENLPTSVVQKTKEFL